MSITFKSVGATAVIFALTAAGCSSSGSDDSADTTRATSSATEAPATTEAPTGEPFATETFAVPFDVVVPTWLSDAPTVEQPNFVTWEAQPGSPTVRFLLPVSVYPPGGTGTTPPPEDYLAYLLGQADHGAVFEDMTEATVDGRPATLVTATTPAPLDGSLGCPADGMTAHDCYGLQPDLDLRIAVVDVDGTPLLAWLRHDRSSGTDPATEFAAFDEVLASVRFR